MKKTVRIVSLLLLAALCAVLLVSCSKYPSLKKAFEKEGYEENEKLGSLAATIKEELEKEDLVVELHLMTKTSNSLTSALIIEFKATDDLVKAYEDSATIQGLVKDIESSEDVEKVYDALEEAGYVKGNCLVVPLSILYVNEITNIVKSV